MNARYHAFVRARQAATHSYRRLRRADRAAARARGRGAAARDDRAWPARGTLIETVAINQLRPRRERLVEQQTQARYAVADSYDRAARDSSPAEQADDAPLPRSRWRSRAVLAAGCAADPQKHTLADLHDVQPDVQEVQVEEGLEKAMQGYRRFLDETPETALTPEAMRRLADLQIEKQFGIRAGDGKPREMAVPERAAIAAAPTAERPVTPSRKRDGRPAESEQEFELRTTAAMRAAVAPLPARPRQIHRQAARGHRAV